MSLDNKSLKFKNKGNLSKCLKFALAYQKMGYPADFRGFVEDLPEH